MNTTNKFETGATTHAINELILFTDNTRSLAERRDFIFNKYANPDRFKPKMRNPIGQIKQDFIDVLLHLCKNVYKSEFPNVEDHQHILKLTTEQQNEYAELYLLDFEGWKKENGYEGWITTKG